MGDDGEGIENNHELLHHPAGGHRHLFLNGESKKKMKDSSICTLLTEIPIKGEKTYMHSLVFIKKFS